MKFNEYLEKNKNKTLKKDFAKNIGVSRMMLYQYRNNINIPSFKILQKIYKLTHGKVQPNDFFPIQTWKSELKQNSQKETNIPSKTDINQQAHQHQQPQTNN